MDVWGELTMDELRYERRGSRRDLERALMRSRGERGAIEDAAVPMLRERVRLLTDELITRYSRDLTLVDELLVPAGGRTGRRDAATAARKPVMA